MNCLEEQADKYNEEKVKIPKISQIKFSTEQ